jgi:hypothetical protein
MTRRRISGQKASDAQERNQHAIAKSPELRASVQQESQATVDSNHPDAASAAATPERELTGVTLAQEERIRARERELDVMTERARMSDQTGRERRTREHVVEQCRAIQSTPDPRPELDRETLGSVNQHAHRIANDIQGGATRAALSRRLAERVANGCELVDAVLELADEAREDTGVIVPIGEVPDVNRGTISVEGEIVQLWEPGHPAIQDVGLIADESGQIKFTTWTKSRCCAVREGDRVRFRAAATNWYQGWCSLALTGDSRVEFPNQEAWWTR